MPIEFVGTPGQDFTRLRVEVRVIGPEARWQLLYDYSGDVDFAALPLGRADPLCQLGRDREDSGLRVVAWEVNNFAHAGSVYGQRLHVKFFLELSPDDIGEA
jgi:hypothetical protein